MNNRQNDKKSNVLKDSDKKEQFLIEEYKSAAQLTYHIDQLRNQVTGFFLTFVGLAAAGLAILLKGEAAEGFFKKPEGVIAMLLMTIAFIGVAVVCILARLRRVQIEQFRIINNVRQHVLQQDYKLWNVVQLSAKTLPMPNRKSGTYFWLFIIILASSSLLGSSAYIFLVHIFGVVCPQWGYVVFAGTIMIGMSLEDRLYFSVARPAPPLVYSQDQPPFNPTV